MFWRTPSPPEAPPQGFAKVHQDCRLSLESYALAARLGHIGSHASTTGMVPKRGPGIGKAWAGRSIALEELPYRLTSSHPLRGFADKRDAFSTGNGGISQRPCQSGLWPDLRMTVRSDMKLGY